MFKKALTSRKGGEGFLFKRYGDARCAVVEHRGTFCALNSHRGGHFFLVQPLSSSSSGRTGTVRNQTASIVSSEPLKMQRMNELWLSPISICELSVLVRKKRVELDDGVEAWVSRTLSQTTFREAPLTNEVALAVSTFQFSIRQITCLWPR